MPRGYGKREPRVNFNRGDVRQVPAGGAPALQGRTPRVNYPALVVFILSLVSPSPGQQSRRADGQQPERSLRGFTRDIAGAARLTGLDCFARIGPGVVDNCKVKGVPVKVNPG